MCNGEDEFPTSGAEENCFTNPGPTRNPAPTRAHCVSQTHRAPLQGAVETYKVDQQELAFLAAHCCAKFPLFNLARGMAAT